MVKRKVAMSKIHKTHFTVPELPWKREKKMSEYANLRVIEKACMTCDYGESVDELMIKCHHHGIEVSDNSVCDDWKKRKPHLVKIKKLDWLR